MIYEECKATLSTTRRRGTIHQSTKHLYAHVTGVLIVIIFIMGPEGGGGPDPHDPLAGSALGFVAMGVRNHFNFSGRIGLSFHAFNESRPPWNKWIARAETATPLDLLVRS